VAEQCRELRSEATPRGSGLDTYQNILCVGSFILIYI
jgi:hypothetical protein